MSVRIPWPWSIAVEVAKAFTDGITLAAQTLCPMDHTAVRRAQAGADALNAVEAEVDHLEPGYCSIRNGSPVSSGCGSGAPGNAWALPDWVEYLAPRNYVQRVRVSHTGAADGGAAVDRPAVPHNQDPSSSVASTADDEGPEDDCDIPQSPSSGQPITSPGVVNTPALGDLTELLHKASNTIDQFACRTQYLTERSSLFDLADQLRDQATQLTDNDPRTTTC